MIGLDSQNKRAVAPFASQRAALCWGRPHRRLEPRPLHALAFLDQSPNTSKFGVSSGQAREVHRTTEQSPKNPRLTTKRYEIRCPIHGFIKLEPWEWDVIQHPVFQRLRRIRQLGWTDMVYPGAMHTRFEHSLGVMHTASEMFDAVWYRQEHVLENLGFSTDIRPRDKIILRLATLLHDVGHSPFSHAGEGVMPMNPEKNKPYKHEQYSAALIRHLMTDVIDDHPINKAGFKITAEEVAQFLEGDPEIGGPLMFWRQLAASQLDADRADYLLRDSYHIGVAYGHYDLRRLVVSLVVGMHETGDHVLAINQGGWHAAESLIIARYMMFTQVYLHKTRRIYDYHLNQVLRTLLAEAQAGSDLFVQDAYPPPTSRENLERYLEWTDWRVQGLLQEGKGGAHGDLLRDRDHYRLLHETKDVASKQEAEQIRKLKESLGNIPCHLDDGVTSDWYKGDEILVTTQPDDELEKKTQPLSAQSKIVDQLKEASMAQLRLYVRSGDRDGAEKIKEEFLATPNEKGAA
jgi:HD superfamily phosphohydrolase